MVTAVTSVVQNGKIVVFIARHNTVEKFNIVIDEEKLEIPKESHKKIMSDNYLSYSTLKAFKVDDIIFCSGLTLCGDLICYQGTSRENYVICKLIIIQVIPGKTKTCCGTFDRKSETQTFRFEVTF